ncbi:MAG TPA: hypothetical protein VHV83_17680 [Armatimonadota bacterium]|nr:hypothetical protein [Armatimonadota bacterium]
MYHFDDEVALKYYRLQKISEDESIVLESGGEYTVSGPAEVGTGRSHEETVELSQLIDVLNERFGTDFTMADQLVFDQFAEESINDPNVQQAALANTFENFRLAYDHRTPKIVIKRMADNQDIVKRFFSDNSFRELFLQFMARQVYDHIRVANAV